MGCLFTKAKLKQYTSNGTRHIQVVTLTSNGIDPVSDRNQHRKHQTAGRDEIAGGPARKEKTSGSSQRRVLTPRPLETCPPTPEVDRLPLSVQYAEDLQPVSPLPDVITVATLAPRTNKVNVSTVSLKSNDSKKQKHNAKLSNNDVSIQDLDTELDEYSKYSRDRYPLKAGERINPAVTDVLLPRRKSKQSDTDDGQQGDTGQAKAKQDRPKSKDKSNRVKNREGTRSKSKERRPKSRDRHKHRKQERAKTPDGVELDLEITDLNDETVEIGDSKDLKDAPKSTVLVSKDVAKAATTGETDKHEPEMVRGLENEKRTSSAKSLESSSVFVPKDIYQKELEKARLKRKRKHGNRDKQTVVDSVGKTDEGKTEEELKRGLKAKSCSESRPGSGTSVWTLESTRSLLSQASRSHVYTSTSRDTIPSPEKSREDSKVSYVPTGTTPISFKQDSCDHDAELVDLESEYGADETTGDGVIVSARVMDPFYGIKPYKAEDEVLEKTPLEDISSGSSTSYLFTKQKLLYSRFARRPYSETHPRLEGKPPLPPGSTLKMRPSSDTDRRNTAFSRYFTTDIDIH